MDEMRKRGRHLVQYFCRCDDSMLSRFYSYLTGRRQRVVINVLSVIGLTLSQVYPRGSLLGPGFSFHYL